MDKQHWAQDTEWRPTKRKAQHKKLQRWTTRIPQNKQKKTGVN